MQHLPHASKRWPLALSLSLSFSHYFSLFLLSMSHIPQANEIFHGILHYKAPVTSPGNFTKMSRPTVWFPGATRPFAYLDPTTNTVLMFYEQYSIFPFRSKVRFVELSEWAIVNMFRLRRGSVSHTPSPSSFPLSFSVLHVPPCSSPPPPKVVWIESISGTRPGDKGEWTWTEPKVALSPELDWESDGQTRVGNPSVHYHPESGKYSSKILRKTDTCTCIYSSIFHKASAGHLKH